MLDNAVYWQRRAETMGRRAVFHVGHDETDLDRVTAVQWAAVAPVLRARLTGRERLALDFGCGTGRFTGELATLIGGGAVGVDPTGPLIREAMQATTERIRFHHTPDGQLPLNDASVDVALVHLVLGGLRGATLDLAVRELMRVLKGDGLLVLVENTSDKPEVEHWAYRTPDNYRAMFPAMELADGGSYLELGERMSILMGRRKTCSVSHEAARIHDDSRVDVYADPRAA